MIEFPNGGVLIEEPGELPLPPRQIDRLYRDYETGSNDPKVKSTNAFIRENCTAIGVGVTWDDNPRAYYVPRKILDGGGRGWLVDLMGAADKCVNHYTKYDAHVEREELGLEFVGDHVCTLAKARVYDADRMYKGGYNLGSLSSTLLDKDIGAYEERLQPYLPRKGKHANKDYSRIPIDIISDYGCQDVLTTRELDLFLDDNLPAESAWVIENETKLTSVLIEMERRGIRIQPNEVKLELMRALIRMEEITDQLTAEARYPVLPSSYNDVYDLLINKLCFPEIVSEKNDKNENASFDKHILKSYAGMSTHAEHRHTVEMIAEYRSLSTHSSLYYETWLRLCDGDGHLHSDYQQNVRSGRTGCKQPNAQQLDYTAKKLIIPRKGYVFLCYDYSQLEYRWMMHYLGNERAIHAYCTEPKTDYHQWVADTLCEGLVRRRPAKTLNFTIGFGGGKKRVTSMLAIEPDIVKMAGGDPGAVRMLALKVYNGYHRNLPELKRNQQWAEAAALRNGYVKTIYERRLHLPAAFAFKGFNRVVQSTAGDNAKEAMVMASPVFNQELARLDVHLVAMVHDEMLFEVPDDENTILCADIEINRCLEFPGARCKVPIIAQRGKPALTWAAAKPE